MFKEKTLVSLIFLFALVIRLIGIFPGYPLNDQSEPTITDSTSRITFDHNFKPLSSYYGSLLPLIYSFVDINLFLPALSLNLPIVYIRQALDGQANLLKFCLSSKTEVIRNCLQFPFRNFWNYSVRIETAILSSFSVILVFLLSKRLFNGKVGLIAAFLTAINYRHVLSSVFSLADAPVAVFILLSLYLSSKLLNSRNWKNYIWAGVGIGLALSTKYFFYTVFPFLFFHLISVWKEQKNIIFIKKLLLIISDKKVFFSLLLSLIIFVAINPYIFLDWKQFALEWDINSRRYGITPGSSDVFNLKNITNISLFQVYYLVRYAFGPILFIFLVFGIIIGLFLNTNATIGFLSLIIPFIYFFLCLSRSPNVRNYSAIVPLLLIFPSIFIFWISKKISDLFKDNSIGKYVIIILVAISGFDGISKSIQVVTDFSKTQNSENAVLWTLNNIPSGSKIIQYWGAAIPGNLNLEVNNIPPISELYVSRQEMQDGNVPWVIVSSDSEGYINNQRWLNNYYVKKFFFDDKLFISFLSEGYGNLVTREFYAYKVAEFLKSNSFISPDPAFFIAKIPPKVNLSTSAPIKIVSKSEIVEKQCRQELTQFPTQNNKVYIVQTILNKKTAKSDIKNQDGYLRLSILTSNGNEVGVSVSKQISSAIPNQELTNYGLVTDSNLTAKLFFQSDNCLNNNYLIKTIKIYGLGLEKYLGKGFSINSTIFPINFLWTIQTL